MSLSGVRMLGIIARSALAVLMLSCASCQWVDSPAFNDYVGPVSSSHSASASIISDQKASPTTSSTASQTKSAASASASQSATSAPASEPAKPEWTLTLSVQQSILMSLENNLAFAVQRYVPKITQTGEDVQRAVFDPILSGGVSQDITHTPTAVHGNIIDWSRTNSTAASLGLSEYLPTGTQVDLTGSVDDSRSGGTDTARGELTVTQSLLQGFGLDVNLASLRIAQINTQISCYQLRSVATELVAQVEKAYWDYILAQLQIDIVEESVRIAQQQLDECNERIKVGKLAETERAAVEAQLAQRHEELINARSTLSSARLAMLRLLSPPGDYLWQKQFILTDLPTPSNYSLQAVGDYIKVGLKLRSDLNQARLQVKQGDLEIIKTRNGLLPVLDAFATLGKTGYSQSVSSAMGNIDDKGYDVLVGVNGSYPIFNRAAKASYHSSVLSRDQSMEAVANLAQLVQYDVRAAYIEVLRLREQIDATAITRRAQEETVRSEIAKFQVGRSTSLLVATAQRDLLTAQIVEVTAMVNYLKSRVELYRLDGSLLDRRGISAPGGAPVVLQGEKTPDLNLE
jgi:outer membrane protein